MSIDKSYFSFLGVIRDSIVSFPKRDSSLDDVVISIDDILKDKRDDDVVLKRFFLG